MQPHQSLVFVNHIYQLPSKNLIRPNGALIGPYLINVSINQLDAQLDVPLIWVTESSYYSIRSFLLNCL